jgi:hypothetical protein
VAGLKPPQPQEDKVSALPLTPLPLTNKSDNVKIPQIDKNVFPAMSFGPNVIELFSVVIYYDF